VSTLPDPVPTSTQYLIAIRAAATNFFDILQIQGKYQHQPKLPHVRFLVPEAFLDIPICDILREQEKAELITDMMQIS